MPKLIFKSLGRPVESQVSRRIAGKYVYAESARCNAQHPTEPGVRCVRYGKCSGSHIGETGPVGNRRLVRWVD